ncbi:polysaccharide biosynthesis C-terminal domain-containing protein [Gibbsiella quercinecans]|uniref:polysaccharide biosynthesis C-terminal domain-containing protein n=1 Tax=Gibbsiella quercinecans TaxID=929813 RepID=UPI003A4DA662
MMHSRNLFGLIICVALNFVLIPLYGLKGSAIATLVAYFCAAYLFDAFHKKHEFLFYKSHGLFGYQVLYFRIKKNILG